MKYSTAQPGRIFILRLENGDVLHETIEAFARAQSIRAAALIALGGADEGSKLVVGPEDGRALPVIPMEHVLAGVHEIAGVGTIFPDAEGQPTLHMHIAAGRNGAAVAGCVRRGVTVWYVTEVVLWELNNSTAHRAPDPAIGFALLQP